MILIMLFIASETKYVTNLGKFSLPKEIATFPGAVFRYWIELF